MKIYSYKDIAQNAPIKKFLTTTGKKLPRPIICNGQNEALCDKIQRLEIYYDPQDLATRICRAYYKWCIGIRLGRKDRKLLLNNGILHYDVHLPNSHK